MGVFPWVAVGKTASANKKNAPGNSAKMNEHYPVSPGHGGLELILNSINIHALIYVHLSGALRQRVSWNAAQEKRTKTNRRALASDEKWSLKAISRPILYHSFFISLIAVHIFFSGGKIHILPTAKAHKASSTRRGQKNVALRMEFTPAPETPDGAITGGELCRGTNQGVTAVKRLPWGNRIILFGLYLLDGIFSPSPFSLSTTGPFCDNCPIPSVWCPPFCTDILPYRAV